MLDEVLGGLLLVPLEVAFDNRHDETEYMGLDPYRQVKRVPAYSQRVRRHLASPARFAAARRIAIIGNGGGGKSTLARALARSRALPLHVVDDIQSAPGWIPDRAALERAHEDWMADPCWIVDGWGSWDQLDARFRAADAVVFLDLPLASHYAGAARRHLAALLGRSEGWPPRGGRVLPVTWLMARTLWRVHHEMRPRLIDLLACPGIAERVVHVRTTNERAGLLSSLG